MKFVVKNSGFRILSHGRVGHFVSSALATVIFSSTAYALPQGGVVQEGSATINAPNQNEMVINQTTQRAIIDWQSFSIAANEKLQIIQPSSTSMLLSRVIGNDPSLIFGQISANGGLMLINQNGILFGKDSKIDVASLVASTSNIRNEDFMAGNMRFMTPSNPNAKIINEGMITAKEGGLVALVAPYIQNNGLIVAKYGTVALAGAATVIIDLYGDNLIVFEATDEVKKTIINSGTIEASYVAMSVNDAKAVVDSSINMSGIIKAQDIDTSGGKVILTDGNIALSGTIDASGETLGGEVRIITNGKLDSTQGYVSATGKEGGFVAFAANELTIPDNSWSVASIGGDQSDFGWYYMGNNISYASTMQNPNLSGSGILSQSPTLFNENQGQFDTSVAFGAMGQNHTVVLSAADAAAYYALNGTVTGIGFNNANSNLLAQGEDAQTSYSNYYINGVAAEGLTDYGTVRYKNLYNGVDLLYYTNKNGEIEHDLIVNPGADASQISYNYNGATATKLANGDLAIMNGNTLLTQKNPLTYQKTELGKHIIASEYQIENDGTAKVNVTDTYDTSKALIIDPVVSYTTYFGGNLSDAAMGVATDSLNNVYITGMTSSISGIATVGVSQTVNNGFDDAFLTKYNSNGAKQWSTYYGGNGYDASFGIVSDGSGGVYITGSTSSTNGLATAGASQTALIGDSDAFLAKFNSGGVKQWSTYYGGDSSDSSAGIATDLFGNVYITGVTYSTSGIATGGASQTSLTGVSDAFLAKFNSGGVKQWSTYYGGNTTDYSTGIAVDGSNNVYITGGTLSTSGIAIMGASQTSLIGFQDAFLAKFNSGGVKQWSTYYGGDGGDNSNGITVDGSGDVYITGTTNSTSGIATAGASQTIHGGGTNDTFLAKFNSGGFKQWSTYYGGNGDDYSLGIAADGSSVYIVGTTSSTSGIATAGALQATISNSNFHDAFLAAFDFNGAKKWATYYGGNGHDVAQDIAIDGSGSIYIAGLTSSSSGLATAGASQTTYLGGGGSSLVLAESDAFLSKFSSSSISPDITIPIIDAATQQEIETALSYLISNPNFGSNMSSFWNWIGSKINPVENANNTGIIEDQIKSFLPNLNKSDLDKAVRNTINIVDNLIYDKPYITTGGAFKALYYAKLAEASYHDETPEGFEALTRFNFKSDDDTKTSGMQAAAYQDTKAKKIIISFRGTEFENVNDVGTDTGIALNDASKSKKQFDQALFYYKFIKNKYPNYEVELTGHSLGGSLAQYVGAATGAKTYAFNPAAVPDGIYQGKEINRYSGNITIVRSAFDTVSASSTMNGSDHLTNNIINVATDTMGKNVVHDIKYSHGIQNLINGLKLATHNSKGEKATNEVEIKDAIKAVARSLLITDADSAYSNRGNDNYGNPIDN